MCSLSLRRGVRVNGTVTGARKHSFGLPRGGLEVPCSLQFKGTPKEVQKVKKLGRVMDSVNSKSLHTVRSYSEIRKFVYLLRIYHVQHLLTVKFSFNNVENIW